MKTTLIILFSLCTLTSAFCAEGVITCEKTYVAPHQMHLEGTSLFVQIGDLWIQPASLQIDSQGMYFNTTLQNERVKGPWQCKKSGCYVWNEEWRDNCKQCGTPRGN